MRRKGVSEVLAIVIILGFIISIATFLTHWSKTYVKDMAEDVTDEGDTASSCMRELIMVSDIYINTSSGSITLAIDNRGTSSARIDSVIAYNLSGDYCILDVSPDTISAGGMAFAGNSTCQIFNLCSAFHYVEATTLCGTRAVRDSLDSGQCV
ncbi:MAG: hypothetical protein U9P44_03905 [archaeon]|nr:hypothetical protein [archaeon]